MGTWRTRSCILLGLFLLMLTACGPYDGEVVVPVVQSAQAAVVGADSMEQDPPDQPQPLKVLSTEDIDLTMQAAEAQGAPRDRCEELQGRVIRTEYPGYLSGEPVPVIIYLPPCYDPYLELYPVIYLLHGKPQTENHWLLLGVEDVVTQGISSGDWPPLILVMPRQPEPLFSDTDGGPGSLEQEFLRGLFPFIMDRYAVTGEREGWAIAGISRGGVWALEIGLHNPQHFASVGALSPALNLNSPREEFDPAWLLENADELPERVFLGAGTRDSARASTQDLVQRLDVRNVLFDYQQVEGTHESSTWRQLLPELLATLTTGW